MSRLENLLGAHALALADRLGSGAAGATGPPAASSERAALVTLLAHPGRTAGWLGEVLGLTSSGVTRLVDRLEAAGWVLRGAGADGRRRPLELTPAGTGSARAILADRQAALGRVVDVLSAAEREQLEALLDKMMTGLTVDPTAALRLCRLCDRAACRGADGRCPVPYPTPDDG
jgi:DNA-binding MarR family transcriptional regulator